MKKKRGRKKGQLGKWCVLPTCSRCYERLHNGNAYKKSDGRFTTYCKACNVDTAIMKAWKKKPLIEIYNQIDKYFHLIELLEEVLHGKLDNELDDMTIDQLLALERRMTNEIQRIITED